MHINSKRTLWLLSGLLALSISVAATPVFLTGQIARFQTPYVTRAEAVMLLLQTRIPKIAPLLSNGEFIDVATGAWYERYIVIGERLGIIDAVNRRIRPEDPVTRAEFLTMAARAFNIVPTEGIAQRFRLFPSDVNPENIRPEEFMIHIEVAKAVRILANQSNTTIVRTPAAFHLSNTSSSSSSARSAESTRGFSIFSFFRQFAPSADPTQAERLRGEVLAFVNAVRAKEGLPILQRNEMLERSAQEYAEHMAQQNFFGHQSPAGETLKHRMQKSGYYQPFLRTGAEYIFGENLARGQKTAKEVIDDWMQSTSHRETIVNPNFTDTGIGISDGLWVEHFGGRQK